MELESGADKELDRGFQEIFDRKILFPPPVKDQGRPVSKGMDYLIPIQEAYGGQVTEDFGQSLLSII